MIRRSQAFPMFTHNGERWAVFMLLSPLAIANGPSSSLAIYRLLLPNSSCTSRTCGWTTTPWFRFRRTAGRNLSPRYTASIPAGNALPS